MRNKSRPLRHGQVSELRDGLPSLPLLTFGLLIHVLTTRSASPVLRPSLVRFVRVNYVYMCTRIYPVLVCIRAYSHI